MFCAVCEDSGSFLDNGAVLFCTCPVGAKAWREIDSEHAAWACTRCMAASVVHVLGKGEKTCPRCCGLRWDPTRENSYLLKRPYSGPDAMFPAGTLCRQATEREERAFFRGEMSKEELKHIVLGDLQAGRIRLLWLGDKLRLVVEESP